MVCSFVGADVGCFRQHLTFLPKHLLRKGVRDKVMGYGILSVEAECSNTCILHACMPAVAIHQPLNKELVRCSPIGTVSVIC